MITGEKNIWTQIPREYYFSFFVFIFYVSSGFLLTLRPKVYRKIYCPTQDLLIQNLVQQCFLVFRVFLVGFLFAGHRNLIFHRLLDLYSRQRVSKFVYQIICLSLIIMSSLLFRYFHAF